MANSSRGADTLAEFLSHWKLTAINLANAAAAQQ